MDKYDQEITISNVSRIRKGTDNRSVRTDLGCKASERLGSIQR